MHNKALIVDNTIAVTGGRNIGNHYFGVDTVFNFRDLDVLVVGPVVPEISSVFDEFWNSVWVFPIEAFLKTELSKDESQRMVQELHEWADAGGDDYPYPVLRSRKEGLAALDATREDLVWAEVEFLFDHPDKASGEEYSPIAARAIQLENELEREVLIEIAYFVPGEEKVRQYREMVDRGMRVRVLTNSLGSIDQVSAFAGYAKYRYVLLRDGVELYELKADAKSGKRYWAFLAAKSRATLHTKTAVFDRKTAWIGSFNADPRSREVNTEMGMLIDSRLLSQMVTEFIETGMKPENSYKLAINERGRDPGERLIWTAEVDGEEVQDTSEPEVTVWLQLSAWLISFLPIEDLL
jgi:putative cardiolipin synthase